MLNKNVTEERLTSKRGSFVQMFSSDVYNSLHYMLFVLYTLKQGWPPTALRFETPKRALCSNGRNADIRILQDRNLNVTHLRI